MGNTRRFFGLKQLLIINFSFLIFTSCSIQQKISKSAKQVINDSSLLTAHVGISIYDPATGKYWYNYQGDKYFVPASNTKLPTCYAAMKYLGDSLKCFLAIENDTALIILPAGDPTFLHPDYKTQPAFDFLKRSKKKIYTTDIKWKSEALGSGWSWNDYNESYMAERSPMPIYGNLLKWVQEKVNNNGMTPFAIYSVPEINWPVNFNIDAKAKNFEVKRKIGENEYELIQGIENYKELNVPFVTHGIKSSIELLSDTVGKKILLNDKTLTKLFEKVEFSAHYIKTQPTDSLLKPMMHRSDNFFAEQSLLMVSNERLGVMNDEKIIDTLLKTDFKDLPQKPRWVDGSGLSRYNLFTPQDFVAILNKMKNEFGMERIKVILPTGGTGTISNYYKADSNFIFAKTGTLSGVVAFSGFLYTKKGKLLIFSTLVNNHQASSTAVRRAVEKFLQGIREKY
ncbi:MAG TPA: D-alanyl-D-alanine carboxypeptidase [Chitinophagaceae bacterium]|nr:D-alanyl-D-alanine carboxypeptidase [Chitinophagaceae bacterium]